MMLQTLQILDIANPQSPVLGSYYYADAYDVAASGNLVYTMGNNTIKVVDVSNPTSATSRASYTVLAHGIDLAGSLLYVASGDTLKIVDFSNLSAPTLRSTCNVPANDVVHVAGNYCYAVYTDAYSTGSAVRIVDVSNPSSPTLRGAYRSVRDVGAISVTGSFAYLADGPGGLQILDASNPSQPSLAGRYGIPLTGNTIAVSNGFAYLAGSGLTILDVRAPASPVKVGWCSTPEEGVAISVVGDLAYVADSNAGLQIIDVSNPLLPQPSGFYPLRYANDVCVQGSLAYVPDYYGLKIINVADPTSPTLRGSYEGSFAYRVSVSGNYASVLDHYWWNDRLLVLDVGDPSSPTLRGKYDVLYQAYNVQVFAKLAYITYLTYYPSRYSSWRGQGLKVLDLSNPTTPTVRGAYEQNASGNVHVSGNLAYVAKGDHAGYRPGGGFEMFDVADPSRPWPKASWDVPDSNVNDVAASGSLILAIGQDTGLWIFRYNPSLPPAPSNLRASPTAWGQIDLSWQDNSRYEDGFKIERRTGTNGVWSQITTTTMDVTSYANTGVPVGVAHYYRVRAYNSAGVSLYSNVTSATAPDGTPAAPSNLWAGWWYEGTMFFRVAYGLRWADNSNNEAGFKIEWKTGLTGVWLFLTTATANVTTYYYHLPGLPPGTTYYFRTRAYNPRGFSAYSNETSYTTPQVLPAAPSNLVVTAWSWNAVLLSWRDNSGNEDGFTIERKEATSGWWAQLVTVGRNDRRFPDVSVLPNMLYSYRVRSYNTAGNSPYSNEASVQTPENRTASRPAWPLYR